MEKKAMKKQLKLAACFVLLTVLLRGAAVEACQQEDQDCSSLACCDGLACVEVSSGVFQCEPEACEEHADHSCEVTARECCDPLVCSCQQTCENCPLKLGDTCDGTQCCQRRATCSTSTNKCECATTCSADCDCCVGAVCSGGNCVCNKSKGDECDPNAAVHECCDLECVGVAVGVYQCQPL